ncbi:hypothetical protein BDZ89DRAFT_1151571 [Hymenopellis radicata]|nr:hypothetical protein BDZ89DRAFT_1151571 [Hymenopellis radicata]
MEIDRPGHVQDLSQVCSGPARSPEPTPLLHHPVPEQPCNKHYDSFSMRGPPHPPPFPVRLVQDRRLWIMVLDILCLCIEREPSRTSLVGVCFLYVRYAGVDIAAGNSLIRETCSPANP